MEVNKGGIDMDKDKKKVVFIASKILGQTEVRFYNGDGYRVKVFEDKYLPDIVKEFLRKNK